MCRLQQTGHNIGDGNCWKAGKLCKYENLYGLYVELCTLRHSIGTEGVSQFFKKVAG